MNLWYVIQTKPKKEKEAESYLAPKGVEIFGPLLETVSFKNGRMQETVKPLFRTISLANSTSIRIIRWSGGEEE